MAQLLAALAWFVPLYICVCSCLPQPTPAEFTIGLGAGICATALLGAYYACEWTVKRGAAWNVSFFAQVLRVFQYGLVCTLWFTGLLPSSSVVAHGFFMYAAYTACDALYQLHTLPLGAQCANALHHAASLYLLKLCASEQLHALGAPILIVYNLSTLPLALRKVLHSGMCGFTPSNALKNANDVALVLLWSAVRMPVTLAYTHRVLLLHGAHFAGFQLLLLLNCMNAVWFVFILRGAKAQIALRRSSTATDGAASGQREKDI